MGAIFDIVVGESHPAVRNAGRMEIEMSDTSKITLHRDGTITYWSVYKQTWVRECDISDPELAAMNSKNRIRTNFHIFRHRPLAIHKRT